MGWPGRQVWLDIRSKDWLKKNSSEFFFVRWMRSENFKMKQLSENGWIWFTNAVSLKKPRRKRSNRKMCAKRAGEGVSPVVTILQMDFQGRGEIIVAKTWLVRYNKRNVIAFSIEWVSFTNTGGTADRMICPVSKWFDTGFFLPRKAIQTRDKEKEREKWKLYQN